PTHPTILPYTTLFRSRHSAAVTPAATVITVPHIRLIVLPPLVLRVELVREWPDPEVISNVAPQPVQPFRLDHQEKDDQDAEQGQDRKSTRLNSSHEWI